MDGDQFRYGVLGCRVHLEGLFQMYNLDQMVMRCFNKANDIDVE